MKSIAHDRMPAYLLYAIKENVTDGLFWQERTFRSSTDRVTVAS